METADLDDLYLEYLYDIVGLFKRGRHRTYFKLFRQLYAKEFEWVVSHDSARSEDGKELRWEFTRAAGLPRVPAQWLYRPCSVLEMIIALARKGSSLTDEPFRDWFTQMLHNLGLMQLSDDTNGHICDPFVDEKMEMLIWRTYKQTGEGGLFPLRFPASDQRGVELWYQLNAWLLERNREEG